MKWLYLTACTLVLLGACGGNYETRRAAALGIGEVLCERAAECDSIGRNEVDECVSLFVQEACAGRDCNAEPAAPNDVIDECIDSLREMRCAASTLPAECVAVL